MSLAWSSKVKGTRPLGLASFLGSFDWDIPRTMVWGNDNHLTIFYCIWFHIVCGRIVCNSRLHSLFYIEWWNLAMLWNWRLNKWLCHVSLHLYFINCQVTSLYVEQTKPITKTIRKSSMWQTTRVIRVGLLASVNQIFRTKTQVCQIICSFFRWSDSEIARCWSCLFAGEILLSCSRVPCIGELLDSFSPPCFAVVGMHYLKLFPPTPSYGGWAVLVGSGSELV